LELKKIIKMESAMNTKIQLLIITILNCLMVQVLYSQSIKINGVISNGCAIQSGETYIMAVNIGQPVIGIASNETNVCGMGIYYQLISQTPTGINEEMKLPTEFRLEQNYPNPFNPTTKIEFAVPKPSFVSMRLFDIRGREIATIVDEELQPGVHAIILDASILSNGIYFYRFHTEEFNAIKKLVVVK
jgi:hypothetical protein